MVFSAAIPTFFFDLIRRWLVLAFLLGFLGALGTLHGELVRSPFSLGPSASFSFFFYSLPLVAAQLLPFCAVLAVVWFCRDYRASGSWMAQRISGQGGRFLLGSLSAFVWVVVVITWLFSVGLSEGAREKQQAILSEHGEVRAGESLRWSDISLFFATSATSPDKKVFFTSERDSLLGAATEVILSLETQSIAFFDGELVRLHSPRMQLAFSELSVELEEPIRGLSPDRRKMEAYKAWTWPLLGAVLMVLGFVFGLEGRSRHVWANCLGAWCLMRLCDHQLALLGPLGVAMLPLLVWSGGLYWKIRHWEEA